MNYKAEKITGKTLKCSSILLLLAASTLVSCSHNHDDHSGHNHDDHGHTHTGSLWEKIFHNHDDDEHDHSGHNHAGHTAHSDDENDTSIFISEKKQQTLGIEVSAVGNIANSTQASTISFSGKTERSVSDHWEITAPVDGTITFNKNFNLGDKISKGTSLFSVSGKNFTEGNVARDKAKIEAEILQTEAALKLAQTDFERAEKAIQFQVISQDKYQHALASLEQAKVKLQALKEQLPRVGQKYGDNTQSVSASKTGIIEELNVNNGSFVNTGTSIIGFSSNENLVASFQVPNQQIEVLKTSNNAKLLVNGKTVAIDNFAQKMKILVANGTQVGYNTIQIAIPKTAKATAGALANLELDIVNTTNSKTTDLIVPKSAVLEDFGLYYCYVEVEKNHFEQRPLEIKDRSSSNIRIESGLKTGEKVVTKNPLQVKFSGVAAVGHSHDH